MALTKQKKHEQVEKLAGELKDSSSAIIGTFAKLTVAQDFALRQKVREAGGKYRVLKNKLAARASQGTKVEEALKGLKGVSSVAYTSGDPVVLAKAVSTWVADNAEFTFKLAIVDGRILDVSEIKQLATMPGKEELFSKLLFLISSPAQRLVTVMSAVGRDLAIVIDQGVKESKFSGGAAAAPAESAKAETTASTTESASPEAPKAEAAPATEAASGETPNAETQAPTAGTSTDPVEGATAAESAAPAETAEVAPEKQAEAAATEPPAEGATEAGS